MSVSKWICVCVCVEGGGRLIELNFRRTLSLLERGLTSIWTLEGRVLRIDFVFACYELMTLWSRNCFRALCCFIMIFNVSYRLLFRCWRAWWWRKLRKFRRSINKSFEMSRTKVLTIDTWSNISPKKVDNIPYDTDGLCAFVVKDDNNTKI